MTSQKQISLFTEEELTSSREVSHVNPTQPQESDLERKTNAIYGLRCLEQFEKFNHVGLWAKTFSALLIGMEGWYSKRCKLTWKMKGTKYNRLYFQLFPSTHHTEETEFGLLPTPMAQDRETTIEQTMKRKEKYGGETRGMYLQNFAVMGMLPTPTRVQMNYKQKQGWEWTGLYWKNEKGQKKQTDLTATISQMIYQGMLPTPTAQDQKHSTTKSLSWDKRIEQKHLAETVLNPYIQENGGSPSHLSPQFVMEMMGFPTDWTELPFLNGETNQSKQEETQ